MPTLHMICGLPGSGKSTLARKLEQDLPALRFTPDEWIERMNEAGHNKGKRKLVEDLQWGVARKALQLGIDVILENGFWSKKERQRFREEATAVGAHTRLYYLDVAPEVLKQRLIKRNKNLPAHTVYINPDLIDLWIKEFEPPSADELL